MSLISNSVRNELSVHELLNLQQIFFAVFSMKSFGMIGVYRIPEDPRECSWGGLTPSAHLPICSIGLPTYRTENDFNICFALFSHCLALTANQ